MRDNDHWWALHLTVHLHISIIPPVKTQVKPPSKHVNVLFSVASHFALCSWSCSTCMRACYPDRQVWQLQSGQGGGLLWLTDSPPLNLHSLKTADILIMELYVWILRLADEAFHETIPHILSGWDRDWENFRLNEDSVLVSQGNLPLILLWDVYLSQHSLGLL